MNRTLSSLHGRSLEITLTVPLRTLCLPEFVLGYRWFHDKEIPCLNQWELNQEYIYLKSLYFSLLYAIKSLKSFEAVLQTC